MVLFKNDKLYRFTHHPTENIKNTLLYKLPAHEKGIDTLEGVSAGVDLAKIQNLAQMLLHHVFVGELVG